jgi:hypothetical protein
VNRPELLNPASKLPAEDAVTTALRAGLERAISNGEAAGAAALATELAARIAATNDPKVIPMAPRRRG